MTNPFLADALALSDRLIAWRRDFHRHPELAFQEHRTAGVIAGVLAQLGLEVQTGVGHTGVVALIEGATDGPTVMLRFDMDALPVHEETGLPFASEVPGKMHACGHDGHVAIGLGVASLLAPRARDLAGRVKLVFQPAEEVANGARAMIDAGVLESPTPHVAFGLHLWSQLPLGRAIVKPGPLWASADRIDLEIVGRGTHGAMPHQGIDAVAVAAYAISELQSVVSRSRDPLAPAVLSIGSIAGGSAFNVLAERVQMSGTLRTFDTVVRQGLIERMHTLLAGLCAAHGASYRLELSDFAPPLVNDPTATIPLRAAAEATLGRENVADGPMLMVAEDMAEYLARIPGSFFVLGAMPEGRTWAEPHHSPRFDVDERALPVGVAILAETAAGYLGEGNK